MPTNLELPVETFEQFMLAGDSPEFPMSFVFEFELAGRMDLSRLNSAISLCAAHHPLLFSVIDEERKNWRFDRELIPPVKSVTGGYHDELRIDLRREGGLRVVVSESNSTPHKIGFIFHHACVDGLGALQFVKDLAEAYESGESSKLESGSSPGDSIQYLRRYRNSGGGNRFLHVLRWPIDAVGMLWALEMVLNRPVAIEPEVPIGSRNDRAVGDGKVTRHCSSVNISRVLTPEQSATVKQQCKAAGQSLNDRMMESFFRAIEEWNARFHPANSGGLIRLMIPMSLRRRPSESAANMVAMVNFDRKAGRWRSPNWFRRILKLEMLAVKTIRAGVTANRYLQLQKLFLGRWPMQTDRSRCYASCVVSNLGDLAAAFGQKPGEAIKFGPVPVNRFQVIALLRPHSNVFFCLFSHLGRLNLNVTFNSNVLTGEQVEFLLDAGVRRLLSE